MGADPVDVLTRFIDAVEAGDLAAVGAIYHPDAVIWHNDDQLEQGVADNLVILGWMAKALPGKRYEQIRRQGWPGGALEQHVLVLPLPGTETVLRIPACLVVAVDDDGRITRLDEYLDSAAVAPLRAWAAGGGAAAAG